MREIKFRGKGNEWAYGSYSENYFPGSHVIIYQNDNKRTISFVNRETVGQYTGLKDRNGKEIYEGDIVYIQRWNREYEVIFEGGMFKVKGNTKFSLATTKGEISCEVIGNVYDNPELVAN